MHAREVVSSRLLLDKLALYSVVLCAENTEKGHSSRHVGVCVAAKLCVRVSTS